MDGWRAKDHSTAFARQVGVSRDNYEIMTLGIYPQIVTCVQMKPKQAALRNDYNTVNTDLESEMLKPTLSGGYAGILPFGGQCRKLLGFGYCVDYVRRAHRLQPKKWLYYNRLNIHLKTWFYQLGLVYYLSVRCSLLFCFLLLFPLLFRFGFSAGRILCVPLILQHLTQQ